MFVPTLCLARMMTFLVYVSVGVDEFGEMRQAQTDKIARRRCARRGSETQGAHTLNTNMPAERAKVVGTQNSRANSVSSQAKFSRASLAHSTHKANGSDFRYSYYYYVRRVVYWHCAERVLCCVAAVTRPVVHIPCRCCVMDTHVNTHTACSECGL